MNAKKIVDMERRIAEQMLHHIQLDLYTFENRNGHRPTRIFLSRPLWHLLLAYNREAIQNWVDPTQSQMFGVPVRRYDVEGFDTLEYHLAAVGGTTTLPMED